jgi:N-acyl homoserine lactone hydrolase
MTTSSPTPQRLYLMQLARATVPLGEGRVLPMVLVCYLVEMSDGTRILIDTGMADEGVANLPYPPEDAKNVLEQLADLNLTSDDIDIVIATHFDPDHVGFHEAFPKAEFIVQRQHYELAREGHPRFLNSRPHWDHTALKYRTVEGDTEILPGLTLIETSGHAPGHQSVLVKLPHTGTVLLAIDAVAQGSQFNVERVASQVDDNQEQLRASTQKLLDIAAREHVAFTVFGHDGGQWRTLKIAPEYYD